MAALKALGKEKGVSFQFQGVGGENMQRQGMEEILPFSDFSIMGFFLNIKKIGKLYRHARFLDQFLRQEKPDLLITIDFPGFNFHLGRRLKGSGIPHLHYGAPTVWAWKPWRAKRIAQFLDHLLVLFPFEPPYFERHGLATTFVGHSLMEEPLVEGNGKEFLSRQGLKPLTPILLILPGSREKELKTLLPIFQKTTLLLKAQGRKFHIVIPTLESIKSFIPLEGWGGDVTIVTDLETKRDAYEAATIALAASGTIALELALARVPMVITYRVGHVTAFLLRLLLKTPYACMINILLKRLVVPEFLQNQCSSRNLSHALYSLLSSELARDKQKRAFERVEKMLTPPQGTPSQNAACVVMEVLERRR